MTDAPSDTVLEVIGLKRQVVSIGSTCTSIALTH